MKVSHISETLNYLQNNHRRELKISSKNNKQYLMQGTKKIGRHGLVLKKRRGTKSAAILFLVYNSFYQ